MKKSLCWAASLLAVSFSIAAAAADPIAEAEIVRLDTEYQLAVKKLDADAMDRILHSEFVLILGSGRVFNKQALLDAARAGNITYEKQDPSNQIARVVGNTGVVTALLHLKGMRSGKPFEYQLWYSDTYVKTDAGWKYYVGQASLPLANPD